MTAVITERPLIGRPFIPCANFQTAWYYKTLANTGHLSPEDWSEYDEWLAADSSAMSPWYLSLDHEEKLN